MEVIYFLNILHLRVDSIGVVVVVEVDHVVVVVGVDHVCIIDCIYNHLIYVFPL